MLCLDIAHGHAEHAIAATRELRRTVDIEIIAGNVATAEGARDLIEAGAHGIKVGVGPGSVCTTRLVAGVGVPQLTAIIECVAVCHEPASRCAPTAASATRRHVQGDRRRRRHVMVGNLLAGRSESPGTSAQARPPQGAPRHGARRCDEAPHEMDGQRADAVDQYVPEGEEMEFPLRGPVSEVIAELVGGLRSGMSYLDSATIEEFWDNARFVRQTEAGQRETHPGSPGE